MIDILARYVPLLDWGRRYDRAALSNDLLAALIDCEQSIEPLVALT